MPGAYAQRCSFEHWVDTYKHLYRAVAFFNIDEFVVLHRHASVKLLLEDVLYPVGGALSINWVLFGKNGHAA